MKLVQTSKSFKVFFFFTLLYSTTLFMGCKSKVASTTGLTYPIVDTKQGLCYDSSTRIDSPEEGEAFYGQDAQYTGNIANYKDNDDGTITDKITGLVWAQELSTSSYTWSDAVKYCDTLTLGGYSDWRLPNVKTLWSIRDFSQGWPWVDTDYFHLVGDGSDQRQHHTWTNNQYLVESEFQNDQVKRDPSFIVNSWTGHIKAMDGARFVRAVRGNQSYGINNFVDNSDGTITDNATSLMWSKDDNGKGLSWQEALAYAESATTAGYDDWRLPNAKELQSIADYSGVFPAMNTTMFNLTELTNIKGQVDYPFYWSGTSNPVEGSDGAVEVGTVYAWVLAAGYNTDPDGNDLHGAGSVVFTPKSEENLTERDPEIHRYNYVRLVRGGSVTKTPNGDPDCINLDRVVSFPEGITSRGGQRGPDRERASDRAGASDRKGASVREGVSDRKGAPVREGVSDREGAPDRKGAPDHEGRSNHAGGPDFSPAADYLSTIGITVSSEELVAIVAGPPAPSASELVANFAAKKIVVTENQAQAMLDLLKLR
jgi:hypothetical protein